MPNRLTRIPESPPPTWNNFRWLVSLADFAMRIFFSTSESGSLSTTWVTPATLWISYLAAIGGVVVAVLCAVHYAQTLALWVALIIIVISCAFAIFCTAIACTGTLQRIISHEAPT
jgi:hypothetical protein